MVLVQLKLLDGHGLSPLAIRRLDRADISPLLSMMMTRQLRSLAAVGFFLAVFIGEVRQDAT